MSDSDSRRAPPTELGAFTVVDLLDAIDQAGGRSDECLEQHVLAGLQKVCACEDLPDVMRALAGRLLADQLAKTPLKGAPVGEWQLH